MKLSRAPSPITKNDENLDSQKPTSLLNNHTRPFGIQPIPSRSYF